MPKPRYAQVSLKQPHIITVYLVVCVVHFCVPLVQIPVKIMNTDFN